jgi:primosomal protein N' (replication factor Y) (superfamily II helicase)
MHKAASELIGLLRNNKKLLILGPQAPLIGRIKLWYHEEIRIKLNRDSQLVASKKYITECIVKTNHLPGNSGVVFSVDVDPA